MQKLKDFCMHITDGEHGSIIDDLKGNYYLLSNKNIVDGNIEINKDDRKINYQTFSKVNKRLHLQKDSIVISTVGSIGKVAIIQDNINFVFQRSVGIINVDKTKLNPYYLLGLLESKPYQTYLNNVATGSIQKCVFISNLENIPIPIKSIEAQNEIGIKLKTIYSKIEINKLIIEKLTNKIKDLFSFYIQERKYYELKKLDKNIANITVGKYDANHKNNEGKYSFFTCSNETLKCDTYSYDGKNILIAGNGTLYVKAVDEKFDAYQRTYVIKPNFNKHFAAIYLSCQETLNSLRTQSNGSIIKFITITMINEIPIPIFPDEINHKLNNLLDLIIHYEHENRILTKLKYQLLNRLLN